MLKTLELQAEATSFVMARADEARTKLQSELDNHESLRREAEAFLKNGDEKAARRLVGLQLQSAEKVKQLKDEYERLQREAEQKVVEYRKSEQEVKKRIEALPRLEQEAYLLREEEQIQRATSKFDLQSPQSAFDKVERELDIRRKQIQNRSLLSTDPNAELDLRIQEAIGARKIEEAMEALRKKINEGAVDAEFTSVSESTEALIGDAQKMLEAPRYQGLGLPTGDERQKEPQPRERLKEEQ
ncbi:MAG TPA: hypothetical protein PLU88_05340 [Armatimonadota bacterium]|nr:hypothetical protein [Armatimonadota bacterium]HPP74531.1 hypothetical protein [Armatimonadota bacterium]